MSRLLQAAGAAAVAIAATGAFLVAEPTMAFGAVDTPSVLPPVAAAAQPDAGVPAIVIPYTVEQRAPAASVPAPVAVEPIPAPVADIAVTTPARPSAGSLADMVRKVGGAGSIDEQLRCLATTVYFESKGESHQGQLAVAKVVLNRTQSRKFATTPCGVMRERGQFSFVRGGQTPAIQTASRAWNDAVAIARIARNDLWDSAVGDKALFFHATHVSPNWKRARVARIDNHIFYR